MLAAMDLKVLCIFASILIISAGAARYDLGPQKFYESSSLGPRRDQNAEAKEVVLYLTPSQIKALQAGGAVVRSGETENNPEEASEEAQQNEDQGVDTVEAEEEQEQEQEDESEAEQPEQQEDSEQSEENQEREEDLEDRDLDLEEIFRILNEEQIEEEEVNEQQSQVAKKTSDNTEEERQVPLRFLLRQKQQQLQQQRQVNSEQRARSNTYAAIRFQRNKQLQKALVQLARQEALPTQDPQEQPETEAPLEKRFKLVPYEVEEQPEELTPEQQAQQAQENQQNQQEQEAQQQTEEQRNEQQENEEKLTELLTSLLSPEKLAEVIGQRKNRLSQNELELQAVLRELKQSSKYNDQKYAIEIERLRANLQKQNALAKAEAVAKAAPHLIKKEIQKQKPVLSAKLIRAPASANRKPELQRQRTFKSQPFPVENPKPVSVPVVKTKKVEVLRPVPVTRNVYAKVNKPYLVERIVPVEIKKEVPVEIPVRKSQRLTILRHVWEH